MPKILDGPSQAKFMEVLLSQSREEEENNLTFILGNPDTINEKRAIIIVVTQFIKYADNDNWIIRGMWKNSPGSRFHYGRGFIACYNLTTRKGLFFKVTSPVCRQIEEREEKAA